MSGRGCSRKKQCITKSLNHRVYNKIPILIIFFFKRLLTGGHAGWAGISGKTLGKLDRDHNPAVLPGIWLGPHGKITWVPPWNLQTPRLEGQADHWPLQHLELLKWHCLTRNTVSQVSHSPAPSPHRVLHSGPRFLFIIMDKPPAFCPILSFS